VNGLDVFRDAAAAPAIGPSRAGEIERQMSRLLVPGDVHELRALGVTLPGEHPRTSLSGYFDNVEDLARAAAKIDGYARGVYYTLNPLRPELLSRAPNRIEMGIDCATDGDVIRRRWLPLDFDPVRPKDSNATDDELGTAIERADLAWRQLRRRGWPEPVAALSGNGVHLLYPIDLAPEDTLVRDVLRKLARDLSDARVKLDAAVHNPSRIWKVYGTTPRKGSATSDRPLRPAVLLRGGLASAGGLGDVL